ncbi:la-related protein 6B [Vitis riparia]|uniref:la-related protein 6B n=1 Tax=Vitis riparia TaxID=96939 RepID=UPI00155AFB32|nr:la-related protein 6B [Vitis riparia]
MAQETLDLDLPSGDLSTPSDSSSLSRNSSFSRLNAQAPEFVPRAPPRPDLPPPRLAMAPAHGVVPVYPGPSSPFHVPIQNHHQHQQHHHHHVQYHQYHQYYGGGFGDHPEGVGQAHQASADSDHVAASRNGLSEEVTQKILNQVEYYFSDVNLATTEHLMRFINKDPEGYVPISVVASFKKIKALVSSHSQLATVLRNSTKLVVSEDGKKVRRLHPLTESDMEELQSRIVVAENLPEDHCHQNLMKIFSAVGSVKTIRTCQPQTSNGGASSASRSSKTDNMLFSNKLHAFVEYESIELAEKAVVELNDEGNWRSGLRVRLMHRRVAKSAQARSRKGHEGEAICEEDDACTSEQLPNDKQPEDPDVHSHEHTGEEHINDKEGAQRKGRSRGRGKGRGRGQYHHHGNRGNHVGTPPNSSINHEQPAVAKPPPGPRMPDGTRGFSMGRGKPVAINIA